jgi:hypothetical protein
MQQHLQDTHDALDHMLVAKDKAVPEQQGRLAGQPAER